MQGNLSEIEKVIQYERKKAGEYKSDFKRVKNENARLQAEMDVLKEEIDRFQTQFSSVSGFVEKLEHCQKALKEAMLNSYICLDFYRDLELYIEENRFEEKNELARKHLDAINGLIHQHGLEAMELESAE